MSAATSVSADARMGSACVDLTQDIEPAVWLDMTQDDEPAVVPRTDVEDLEFGVDDAVDFFDDIDVDIDMDDEEIHRAGRSDWNRRHGIGADATTVETHPFVFAEDIEFGDGEELAAAIEMEQCLDID